MKNQSNFNKFFDEFFYFFSKIILFLPIFFLIFVLLIRFSQIKEEKKININLTPTLKTKYPSPTKTKNVDFDLTNPLICSFSKNDASISAYIKQKNIKLIIEEKGKKSYFLVNNDCLYKWEEDQFTGNKSCGVNKYLDLIGVLFKNNQYLFFNSLLKKNEIINFDNDKDFSFSKICKEQDFSDQFFFIPRNILFKNTELNF